MSPLPPSMVDSLAVERLPVELLSRVFTHALFDDDQAGWQNGGELVGWDSHGQATKLARVCRSWNGPATKLLYESVDIRGARAANSFLETMRGRPELLVMVRSVVVGLGDLEEVADGSMGHVPVSFTLMDALDLLPVVERVQIRPLHVAVAQRLADFLARARTRTLVLSDRIVLPSPTWTHGLFDHLEWAEVLIKTERLDVNWDEDDGPPLPRPKKPLPPLHLQQCILRMPKGFSDAFFRFFGAIRSEDLRVLCIYTEQRVSPKKLAASLSHLQQLRHLRFIINPPIEQHPSPDSSPSPPLIDLLLPHLPRLISLDVSANDVTASVFDALPDTLRSFKISVFSPQDATTCPSIADDIRLRPHSLNAFSLVDSKARWKQGDLEAVEQACLERGVGFSFIDDDLALAPTSSPSLGSTSTGSSSESLPPQP